MFYLDTDAPPWSRSSGARRSRCAWLLLAIVAVGATSFDFAAPPRDEAIDALFAKWNRAGSPGAAVVVVKDDAIVLERAYGWADLAHEFPITTRTRFDAASLAKQFTGFAVAQLVVTGKLSLADDIHRYVPAVPDFGQPITLDELAHHTSGLRDWPELLLVSGSDLTEPVTMDTVLDLVRHQRDLDFPPGSEFQYSNTGYDLLALAVARASGTSFWQYLATRVFAPLDMMHSVIRDDPDELVPDLAEGYAAEPGDRYRHVADQLAVPGDGSLITTVDDLGKWLVNFDTATVGGRAALALMQRRGTLAKGEPVDYGLGLRIADSHGRTILAHAGAVPGYRSAMLYVPEARLGVALLSNASDLDASTIAGQIADLYLDRPISAPKVASSPPPSSAAKLDVRTYERFEGLYRLEPGWLLVIVRDGDRLMVQASGEDRFEATPVSPTEVFVSAYHAPIDFLPQKPGAPVRLRYHGITATKLDLNRQPTAGSEAYDGDYWSDELRRGVVLAHQDGRLTFRPPAGGEVEFLPAGRDRFDSMKGWLLEFTRDHAGAVIGFRLSTGRIRHLRFLKVAPGPTN